MANNAVCDQRRRTSGPLGDPEAACNFAQGAACRPDTGPGASGSLGTSRSTPMSAIGVWHRPIDANRQVAKAARCSARTKCNANTPVAPRAIACTPPCGPKRSRRPHGQRPTRRPRTPSPSPTPPPTCRGASLQELVRIAWLAMDAPAEGRPPYFSMPEPLEAEDHLALRTLFAVAPHPTASDDLLCAITNAMRVALGGRPTTDDYRPKTDDRPTSADRRLRGGLGD